MIYSDLIKKIQSAMNAAGSKLTVDGDPGPVTQRECEKYEFAVSAKPIQVLEPVPTPKPAPSGGYFGALWVGANNDLLGLLETDKRLMERFVPHWARVGLPGYKSLSGSSFAHCALVLDANFYAVGIKGPGSAGASRTSKWGDKCPFWFGAALHIKHNKGKGGNHTCIFLYWIDEAKGICATKDSNRSNKYGIFETDISGKGDVVIGGPRWPKGHPPGQLVSKAEVLKRYPELKVGSKGTGGSTR